jgi:WNK lysine deficient protein kinase
MTEAEQLSFDSHKMASMEAFRNPLLIMNDNNNNNNMPTTIADHINYQLSQIDSTYNNTIDTFIQNHTLNQDLIDRTNQRVESVVEWSPNKRYCRLNTLLGKGAFKVVHKAMDLEEGYEVAWNVLHV